MPLLPPSTPGRWLILADDHGFGDALASELQALGETVTVITDEIAAVTDSLTQLLAGTAGLPLRGVLHLWGLNAGQDTGQNEPPGGVAELMEQQERNLSSVLEVVQVLAGAGGRGTTPRLWVVTRGAQQVASTDAVAVTETPLWGLGRVIALEHGELWGGLVDVDAATPLSVVLAEVLQPRFDGETQVAYRQGTRYVARLVRSATPGRGESTPAIQDGAVYLVTGGLGALGLLVAEWLAERGARHLILTGRHGVTTDGQREAVRRLQESGVRVQIALVDVADEAGMRELFAGIATGEWPLKGVVHAAGVLDDAILLNQRWERFAGVLAPKVAGGWLLHQLTQQMELDFMVFFSSAAALLGSMGQGSYAAANAFLDGLARYRQQQGLPGLSINWGAWAEVGMAARTAHGALAAGQMISPLLGVATLAQLLTRGGQVGVLPMEWRELESSGRVYQPLLANFVKPAAVTAARQAVLVEVLASLPLNQRPAHLSGHVQQAVAKVLGMTELPDPVVGFAELGMDSLMALELRRRLEGDVGCALPATLAFEYPTVDELASYLLKEVLALVAPAAGATDDSMKARDGLSLQEPIAVISMACRFPGADTPEAFWQLLRDGVDMVREVPAERWDVDAYYDPQRPLPGKMYMREAAFVEGVEGFDPLFFGIAPREAVGMDPQHRLLLEVSWEALERAGLAPGTLVDSPTGVFVGIGASEYAYGWPKGRIARLRKPPGHWKRAQHSGRPAGVHVGTAGTDAGGGYGMLLIAGGLAPGVPEPARRGM